MRSSEVNPSSPTDGRRLLLFILASILTANLLPWLVYHALHLGSPPSLKPALLDLLHLHQWTDSWLPMLRSLDYFAAHPDRPLYAAPLYDTLIYPLPSLLPLWLLRKLGLTDPAILRLLALTSALALAGIALLGLRLGQLLLARRGQRLDPATLLALPLACLFNYPLLKGYALGNAQTFLSFGFALLLLLWTQHRERRAGLLAALLTLVKPQFALLLLWMVLRRRWSATIAFLLTTAVLLTLSIAIFGLHNNLDYLAVLSSLSREAQSHYANQSLFGTLNRVLGNGENLTYTPLVYTPYIPWVYRTTVAFALLLTGLALFYPWRALRNSPADLAATALASVAASPMAWEHHYGILPALFAWLWFAHAAHQPHRPWLLALAFFLTTNFLSPLNLLAPYHGPNLLQSYLWIGALLLLALLFLTDRRLSTTNLNPVP